MAKIVQVINTVKEFVLKDIWRIDHGKLPKIKAWFFKQIKVLIISAREFIQDKAGIRASALTFYSVLSIVPVLAVAFAVAQGFGLEDILEEQIRTSFQGQDQVMEKAIEFSHSSLQNAKGGLIAGISILFLLWSVIKLFNHIENAFNHIWKIDQPRTFLRKFTDYLTLILIAPVFIIVSSGIPVFISSEVQTLSQTNDILEITGSVVLWFMQLAPFVLSSVLFTMIYLIMPNKTIQFGAALTGGIVAGIAFQALQYGYINFQFAMSRYNTVYGSFAALPLFLIWLQSSWNIILYGAKLAYATEYIDQYNPFYDNKALSFRLMKITCIRVMKEVAERFERNAEMPSRQLLTDQIQLPLAISNQAIDFLLQCELLVYVPSEDGKQLRLFPATSVNNLSYHYVIQKLENNGLNMVDFNDAEMIAISLEIDAMPDGANKQLLKKLLIAN